MRDASLEQVVVEGRPRLQEWPLVAHAYSARDATVINKTAFWLTLLASSYYAYGIEGGWLVGEAISRNRRVFIHTKQDVPDSATRHLVIYKLRTRAGMRWRHPDHSRRIFVKQKWRVRNPRFTHRRWRCRRATPPDYHRVYLDLLTFQIYTRSTTAPIARRTLRAYVSSASNVPNSTFACRWVEHIRTLILDHVISSFSLCDPLLSLLFFLSLLPCLFIFFFFRLFRIHSFFILLVNDIFDFIIFCTRFLLCVIPMCHYPSILSRICKWSC